MKKSAVFAGAAVLVGDAVVLNMLYFTFAYLQTERLMNLGVVPWAPCALLLFLGNVLFLRKPRPLPAIAGLNLLGFAGMTALVFYHSEQVEGFLPVAFAVFFLILTAVRAFSVAMHSLTVSRMLTILGVHLLGLCFFALAQGGGGLPVEYNGILFAALIVEITALAFLRTFGDGRNILCGSKWQGIILLAGMFGALAALLALFFTLLSSGARSAASAIAASVGSAVKAALHGLLRLINWLLSLIPLGTEEEFVPPPGFETGAMQGSQEFGEVVLDPAVLIAAGIVVAVLLAGLAVYLLYRFRRVKISLPSIKGGAAIASKPKLFAGLRRRIGELFAVLRFRFFALYYRNTAPGVLICLERWGRRHDLPRLKGETNAGFLSRIARQPQFAGEETALLLGRLRRDLDRMYYAPGKKTDADCLSRRELRAISSRARKMGRVSKGSKKPKFSR